MKHLLKDQKEGEENKQPTQTLTAMNEMKLLHSPEREVVPLDKHKLEVEQRVDIPSMICSTALVMPLLV